MTREEAIKELQGLIPRPAIICSWTEKHREALLMAIDALNPWKSVKEELPGCDMLMVDYHGIPMVAQYYTNGYDTKSWWDINGESYGINEIRDRFTHFMPIPELPKEDTK